MTTLLNLELVSERGFRATRAGLPRNSRTRFGWSRFDFALNHRTWFGFW